MQVKISVREDDDAFLFWLRDGNTVDESVQVCRWLEEAGADAIHVSAGTTFPHPLNPAGDLPLEGARQNYDGLISSGSAAFRNYLLYRLPVINRLMQKRWSRPRRARSRGRTWTRRARSRRRSRSPSSARAASRRPRSCARRLADGDCDAVTIARPLVANPNLLELWQAGHDRPPRPCTFSNKCLFNLLESPLGCYDESRFDSREEMLREYPSSVVRVSVGA